MNKAQVLPLLLALGVVPPVSAEVFVERADDQVSVSPARQNQAAIRTKARTAQRSRLDAPTTVLQVSEEDEEGGVLSPGGRLPEMRAKAFGYEKGLPGTSGAGVDNAVIMRERDRTGPASARESADENRSRAAAYMRGDGSVPSNVVPEGPVLAKDAPPVIRCETPNKQGNVTAGVVGQIGEAVQPGTTVTIFQNGRQIKVKCQP